MLNLVRRAALMLTGCTLFVPAFVLHLMTVSAFVLTVSAVAMPDVALADDDDDDDDDSGYGDDDDDDDDDRVDRPRPKRCKDYARLRRPFFGETHLHTGLSFDATLRFTRATPREAFRFAKGKAIIIGANADGLRVQEYEINRRIDWGAVTDHSEYFGELGICADPYSNGRSSLDCKLLLGFGYDPELGVQMPAELRRSLASAGFNAVDFPTIVPVSRATQMPLCTSDGPGGDAEEECLESELSVWEEVQAAADEENDPCDFTAFRAYENTSTPDATNWHRNVIFKDKPTIPRPISAVDLSQEVNPDPRTNQPVYGPPLDPSINFKPTGPDLNKLFDGLQKQCLDKKNGCDVVVIPHNSNLGPQVLNEDNEVVVPSQWYDPADAEEAAKWRRFQPLVEIHQAKGNSECRFDPRFGEGVDTTDEDCAFEILASSSLVAAAGGGTGSTQTPDDTDPRTLVRNVLKAGLKNQDKYGGINPFKIGFVAATDNHNGTMGWNPEDETYFGHEGIEDFQMTRKVSNAQNNAGGIGVVWAEQNTRHSIFAALKRRETYATSGIRPTVRFFGGWEFDKIDNLCSKNFARTGYRKGVPMGGDLRRRPSGESPDFIVSAIYDDCSGPGRPEAVGLEKVQIIKGWLDPDTGDTHEAVYTVAGETNSGAWVDNQCRPTGLGYERLCTVWTDPDFDPEQRAFYYARVIENPTCRLTTRICQARFGVNILDGQEACQAQLEDLPSSQRADATACCTQTRPDDTTSDLLQPVIQERAWTSPIYYTPK